MKEPLKLKNVLNKIFCSHEFCWYIIGDIFVEAVINIIKKEIENFDVFQTLGLNIALPGEGSTLARNSRCGRNLCKLHGSPVLCSAITNSLTLWEKDCGVCN